MGRAAQPLHDLFCVIAIAPAGSAQVRCREDREIRTRTNASTFPLRGSMSRTGAHSSQHAHEQKVTALSFAGSRFIIGMMRDRHRYESRRRQGGLRCFPRQLIAVTPIEYLVGIVLPCHDRDRCTQQHRRCHDLALHSFRPIIFSLTLPNCHHRFFARQVALLFYCRAMFPQPLRRV